MAKAVTDKKGMTAMSALVVRASKLDDLVKAMYDIQTELSSAGEIAEIANINSVRRNAPIVQKPCITILTTIAYLQLANVFLCLLVE
jgi:hypothetical protein